MQPRSVALPCENSSVVEDEGCDMNTVAMRWRRLVGMSA